MSRGIFALFLLYAGIRFILDSIKDFKTNKLRAIISFVLSLLFLLFVLFLIKYNLISSFFYF